MHAHGKSLASFILPFLLCMGHVHCGDQTEPVKPERSCILDRIGVMGASVSAGVGNQGIRLAFYLDGAILFPHEMIDASIAMFGLSPDACGFNAISRLKREKATVVFGVDYFYWFSHGFYTFEGRKALLERGCALAEELECPFVAGDIPDLWNSPVAERAPNLLPNPQEIELLNKQLHQWAEKHDHVLLLPLADMVASMKRVEPLLVNGKKQTYKLEEILHWDGVHPTVKGSALLALVALGALAEKYGLDKSKLLLDVDALIKALKDKARKQEQKKKEKG